MGYWMLVAVTLVIGCAATGYVNAQIKKYSSVRFSAGWSGADAAYRMLRYYGITDVPISGGGKGQDFYDPRSNSITLSPTAFGPSSVTAIATACHEAGHACQYAQGYTPMKIRGAMVPVVNLCSNAWVFILLIGIVLNMAQLQYLAIALYAAVVLFELVTLPVEFNASRRALAYMEAVGVPQAERVGARKVLTSCALTYVAAALTSILQLLWLLGQDRD